MSNFSDLFTFTRSTTATYKDPSTGRIFDSAINSKRINANGLLIEQSATNLLTYSEYQNDVFTPNSNVITTETMSFRNGVTSKCCYFDSTADTKYAYRSLSVTSNQYYYISFFVEFLDDLGAPTFSGLSTASTRPFSVVVNGSGSSGGEIVEHLFGKVYRISNLRLGSTGSGQHGIIRYSTNQIRPFKVSGFQMQFAGTSSAYISYSSYIPTTSAQVTRTADTCSRTLGAEYNTTKGTFYLKFKTNTLSYGSTFAALGLPAGGKDLVTYSSNALRANNGTTNEAYPGTTPVAGNTETVAISIDSSNRWILSRQGLTTVNESPAGAVLCDIATIGLPRIGWLTVTEFKYWPRVMTETELAELTA